MRKIKGLKKICSVVALTIAAVLLMSAGYGSSAYTWGTSGDTVKSIQEKLRRWGYYNGSVDGVYGYQTWEAVQNYQIKNGIGDSGIAGAETLEALGLMDTQAHTGISARDNDIWLLASFIEAEAGNGSYIGQVAVGAVVMNRVSHPSFPDTVSGVIFQPGAFSTASESDLSKNPSPEAVAAARDAVNGWDPANGATYYWNPAGSALGMPVTKTIDSLYFGYR